MIKRKHLFAFIIGAFLFQNASAQLANITQQQAATGLKEALNVGTKQAASILSATNGYFGDAAVKILLPPEAKQILANVSKIPGGKKMVDDVVLRINRAAEEAAKEATPIFTQAITGMSFTDALNILKGSNDAATQYLKGQTQTQLFNLFKPKMQAATDKPIVAGISANQSWNTLTKQWNSLAGTYVGKQSGYKKVSTNLNDYLTQKGLDGMFLKIADKEKEIRANPTAQASSILQSVFGALTK